MKLPVVEGMFAAGPCSKQRLSTEIRSHTHKRVRVKGDGQQELSPRAMVPNGVYIRTMCVLCEVSHSARHPTPATGLAGVFPEASSHGCSRR